MTIELSESEARAWANSAVFLARTLPKDSEMTKFLKIMSTQLTVALQPVELYHSTNEDEENGASQELFEFHLRET